jgi:two-component system chemotaxis response regulator CheY
MAKILIVDDSPSLRRELKEFLESHRHEIMEAENGLEGLEVLTKNPHIDLLILDVNMPVLDGIGMCERIPDIFVGQERPDIIMLTTETKQDLKDKARLLGVRAWVTKPFIPEKFLLGLNKMLAKGKTYR